MGNGGEIVSSAGTILTSMPSMSFGAGLIGRFVGSAVVVVVVTGTMIISPARAGEVRRSDTTE